MGKIVQISLQDKNSCNHIYVLLAVFPADSGFHHGAVCFDRCQPLVPHNNGQACPSLQHFFELERFFGPLSDVVVHMFREAEYDFFHAVLFCYLFNPGQRLAQLILRFSADNFDSLRSKTQRVADCHPYCF